MKHREKMTKKISNGEDDVVAKEERFKGCSVNCGPIMDHAFEIRLCHTCHTTMYTSTNKRDHTHGQLGNKNVQAIGFGNSNPWQSINLWLLILVVECIRLVR
ncbi:hypothetical protein HA466_0029420 [Hirschfeldia incana]|nr:hypothetical protein HA466_0029420 [Hirschfeldia incana]